MDYIIEEGKEFNLRNLTDLSEYNERQPASIELDTEDENLESRMLFIIERIYKTIADKEPYDASYAGGGIDISISELD
ncbi:hypothetical protein BD560DRAFT_443051 [Blakeslea trispora]|nr:hypothetical protein BD560DRAFT_443051 [Blakeslea trispora]